MLSTRDFPSNLQPGCPFPETERQGLNRAGIQPGKHWDHFQRNVSRVPMLVHAFLETSYFHRLTDFTSLDLEKILLANHPKMVLSGYACIVCI